MKTFKEYLAEHVLVEGKKYKHPDAPTINNLVAKHAVNKSGAGEHTVKTKMKKKYAKRKDKHKGKLEY